MIKTAMLMAAMTALFGFAGIMLGGFEGLLIAITTGHSDESVRLVQFRQDGSSDVRS